MFKFYFVCSLSAMILRQNHPDWTLLAKEGLVLEETWIYLKILWRFYKDFTKTLFKFLSWLFGQVEKTLIRKIRLISKFMKSQPG